jgi:hypothetical protein
MMLKILIKVTQIPMQIISNIRRLKVENQLLFRRFF